MLVGGDPNMEEESNPLAKRKFEDAEVCDEGANAKRSKADSEAQDESQPYNLLYFSDDVLLCILRYCRPRELKALSFCCVRLARLCMDRSLWRAVELREQAVGAKSLSFYAQCVQPTTTSFYVRGLIGTRSAKPTPPFAEGPKSCDCINPDYIENVIRSAKSKTESPERGDPFVSSQSLPEDIAESILDSEDLLNSFDSNANSRPRNRRDSDDEETRRRMNLSYVADAWNLRSAGDPSSSDDSNDADQSLPSTSKGASPKPVDAPGTSKDCGSEKKDNLSNSGPAKLSPLKIGNSSPKPFSVAYEDYNYPPSSSKSSDSLAASSSFNSSGSSLAYKKDEETADSNLPNVPTSIKLSPGRSLKDNGNTSPKPFSATYNNSSVLTGDGKYNNDPLDLMRDAREILKGNDPLAAFNPSSISNPPSTSTQSLKIPKENGNTSPKPFSAAYENYPSFTRTETKDVEMKKETPKKDQKKKKMAECCKYRNICVASITDNILNKIKRRCQNLVDLRLEYCNLDCNPFCISDLPKSLKILSLKGSKRTTLSFQKPFLFRIQDHLPDLEEIDLSYCQWLNGHYLILLSKIVHLRKLLLRGCSQLGECVAYASLSTRFGFKALQILDIRGTSVGDSEISSFGSIIGLKELYLEPPKSNDETIFLPTEWPEHSGLMESWETQAPCKEVEEYIKLMNRDSSDDKPSQSDDPQNDTNKKETNKKTDYNINTSNVNLIYRSIVDLAYDERRNPQNPQNGGANRQPNENANQQVPDRPNNPENMPRMPRDIQQAAVGVQVGLGVQVRPLQRGAGGVQVGPVEVQVGPEGVQVGLDGPIGVRVGDAFYAEVQVGEVSIEVGRERQQRRQNQDNERPQGDGPANGDAQQNQRAAPNNNQNVDEDAAGQNPRRPELPIELAGVNVEPFWMNVENENGENRNQNHRIFDIGPLGVRVRVRHSIRNPNQGERQQAAQPDAANAQNPEQPNDPRRPEQPQQNDPRRVEWPFRMAMPGPDMAPPQEPNQNDPPRPERLNFMDGRVHVIYVDPGRARIMPGARCVAHQIGDGNAPVRNLQHLFDMPLIQLPFWRDVSHLRHLDGAELVTDASLLRLGDSEQLVHVGPLFRQRRTSQLEVLVCRGYRGVTNRSLCHLASAAPSLRFLDVEHCGVTEQGIASFMIIRPDCVIHFKPEPENEI